jgi:GT2 family glycosyltransferase
LWNALNYLKITIKSILDTVHIPFSLTLIDDGSKPEVIEYLKTIKPVDNLKYVYKIFHKTNKGIPVSSNDAIEISLKKGYEFTCFSNNDVYFSDNWLETLINDIDKDKNIAMLNPLRTSRTTMYNSEYSTMHKLKSLKETNNWKKELEKFTGLPYTKFECFVKRIKRVNIYKGLEYIEFPDILSNCVVLFRNDIYAKLDKQIGGLIRKDFGKYGSDDANLTWNFITNGYKCAI